MLAEELAISNVTKRSMKTNFRRNLKRSLKNLIKIKKNSSAQEMEKIGDTNRPTTKCELS